MLRRLFDVSIQGSARLVAGQVALVFAGFFLVWSSASVTKRPVAFEPPYEGGLEAANVVLDEFGIAPEASTLIAIWPSEVCLALNEIYGDRGISCEYCRFDSIDELRDRDAAIAVLYATDLVPQYVVVMCIDEAGVTVSDPAKGTVTYTRDEFRKKWRGGTIVFRRKLVWATDYV